MNHGYIIPGGVWEDLPVGWDRVLRKIIDVMPKRLDEYEALLTENPIFLERTKGVGVITAEQARALGATGPIARASGIDWDLRRDMPYEAYGDVEFKVPDRNRR